LEWSVPAKEVIETLGLLFLLRHRSVPLCSDNVLELTAKARRRWPAQHLVKPVYIDPDSLWENGLVESFRDKFRDECLNREVFRNGIVAITSIEPWRDYCNDERLHSGLGYKTPAEFAAASIQPTGLPCHPEWTI
jgi:putative transposase